MEAVKKSYRERYEKITSQFRLMDDDFMTLVFGGNIEATQLLLNILLEDSSLTVIETVGQFEIKNPNGRSVRLDIHAVDANGQHFDVEVQRASKGAGAERARFNSSMLDTRMASIGDKIPELKPAYVIFITEKDVLGGGFPLYHIDRKIDELDNKLFGDGSHIIYVNGEYNNSEDPIGMLMHDFHCTSASEMYYSILANRVRYFKETEGGQDNMCKLMEDFRDEIARDSAIEASIDTARQFGISEDAILENIMGRFNLTESEAKSYMLEKSA
ncbi:MAG: Rpn family recombination-promoting nuclease/putative transposase [Oscillospiraceae bacterium]|nr:Rpn family recombination-promoting nuclease/putative transposase [Oscillospiraceae bacterium]